MQRLTKRDYERLNGIDAVLIAILTEAIKNSPYVFAIPRSGGKRSAEDQNKIYQIGRTIKMHKGIRTYKDGYKKKSYHQSGKAFDVYCVINGTPVWNKDQLKEIAQHIKKIALNEFDTVLKWGGDWTRFKDYPHFQID